MLSLSEVNRLGRMLAAYKLKIAERAKVVGAPEATWGDGLEIDLEQEKSFIEPEDEFRVSPYPYPGLRSFDSNEGEYYFGRDEDVNRIRDMLSQSRIVAILGGSGSGKSSLIKAGLLPFLNTSKRVSKRPGNWYYAEFRPRLDPFSELAAALARQIFVSNIPLIEEDHGTLGRALGLSKELNYDNVFTSIKLKLGDDCTIQQLIGFIDEDVDMLDKLLTKGNRLSKPNLLLLIDQFEEIFRPEIPEQKRKRLIELIIEFHKMSENSIHTHGGLYIVITARSEEIFKFAQYKGLSKIIVSSGWQLDLLDVHDRDDKQSLLAAIRKPARYVFDDWGLASQLKTEDSPFEPKLPLKFLSAMSKLSREIDHQPDQLPLLQHALQATWHNAMRRWSQELEQGIGSDLQIKTVDVPCLSLDDEPNLTASLALRADKAAERAALAYLSECEVGDGKSGANAVSAALRSFARRDDRSGTWVRQFSSVADAIHYIEADKSIASCKKVESAVEKMLGVFLLRGYLNKSSGDIYDISHEALIRRWPSFQLWLKDLDEAARSIAKSLEEGNPSTTDARQLANQFSDDVALPIIGIGRDGVPKDWAEEQINEVIRGNRSLQEKWGDQPSIIVSNLSAFATRIVEGRALLAQDREREVVKRERYKRNRRLRWGGFLGLFLLVTVSGLLGLGAMARYKGVGLIGASTSDQVIWNPSRPDAQDTAADSIKALALVQAERLMSNRASLRLADVSETLLSQIFAKPTAESARWDATVRSILGRRISNRRLSTGEPSPTVAQCFTAKSGETKELTATLQSPSGPIVTVALQASDRNTFQLRFGSRGYSALFQRTNWEIREGDQVCISRDASMLTIAGKDKLVPGAYELIWTPVSNFGWIVNQGIARSPVLRLNSSSCVREVQPLPEVGKTYEQVITYVRSLDCSSSSRSQLFELSFLPMVAAPRVARVNTLGKRIPLTCAQKPQETSVVCNGEVGPLKVDLNGQAIPEPGGDNEVKPLPATFWQWNLGVSNHEDYSNAVFEANAITSVDVIGSDASVDGSALVLKDSLGNGMAFIIGAQTLNYLLATRVDEGINDLVALPSELLAVLPNESIDVLNSQSNRKLKELLGNLQRSGSK